MTELWSLWPRWAVLCLLLCPLGLGIQTSVAQLQSEFEFHARHLETRRFPGNFSDFSIPLQPQTFFGHVFEGWSWAVAVPISLLGSYLGVSGMLIQKYSHQKADEKDPENAHKRIVYCLDPVWIVGICFMALGNFVTWIALSMAPNAVLASFDSSSIIFSMVVSHYVFDEIISDTCKVAAGILILGCVWVAIAGPRSYRLKDESALNLLFTQVPMTICLIASATTAAGSLCLYCWRDQAKRWPLHLIVAVAIVAALCSCYSTLFAKCTSMTVQALIKSRSDAADELLNELLPLLNNSQFVLWMLLTFITAPIGIFFINEGLQHGDASYFIPLFHSLGLALSVTMGGVFFREYDSFTLSQHLLFWPGVAIVLLGLIRLTCSQAASFKAEKDAEIIDST